MKIPACQLAIICRHRWDIGKLFHQLKGKIEEGESWPVQKPPPGQLPSLRFRDETAV